MPNIILFLCAFLICYVLIYGLERFARGRGCLMKTVPAAGGEGVRRVSYCGGLAMFFSFLTAAWLNMRVSQTAFADFRPALLFVLTAAAAVFFGTVDDVFELRPLQKLGGQAAAALLFVIFVARTEIIYIPVWANYLLSMGWIMVMINAVNLLDILDGLAGSISAVSLLWLFQFGFFTGSAAVMQFAAILCGTVLAFLRFNLPPARIFMGDAGSQFLGFCLAGLSIILSFAPEGREAGLVIPLVILSVPLLDMLFVVVMRLRQKRPVLQKSNDHFVLRLLKTGVSQQMIAVIMVLLSFLSYVCALVIFRVSNSAGMAVFAAFIAVFLSAGIKLGRLNMN